MLKDKVVLITGASRGIGRAVARGFVREGARVMLVARSSDDLADAENEFNTLSDGHALAIATDVSKPIDVQEMIRKASAPFGVVDVLVNAAGSQQPIGPLMSVDAQSWMRDVEINLFGTMLCCRAVLPGMMARKYGKIINFSGGGAASPRPNFSAYACAKAAVVRFTETLAFEMKEYGVDINAIAPGPVNTHMTQEVVDAKDAAGAGEFQQAVQRLQDGGVSVDKAVDLVLFLGSERSDGLTGKLISAVWDDWRQFKDLKGVTASDLFTLRRIDGKNFAGK
ncbi:MAG: SDR family oxidoreductase [Candidatus Omnitrophica bacterium]|nr:SDR family oxidoreductase [Candidatus Omnitrophota bacterium]